MTQVGCLRSVKPEGETHQMETMTSKDAMRFPFVGSAVLLSLFIAYKFLPKEYDPMTHIRTVPQPVLMTGFVTADGSTHSSQYTFSGWGCLRFLRQYILWLKNGCRRPYEARK